MLKSFQKNNFVLFNFKSYKNKVALVFLIFWHRSQFTAILLFSPKKQLTDNSLDTLTHFLILWQAQDV